MEQSFADGEYADLADQLRANVSRFAAYKANYIKEKYKETADDPTLTPEQRQKALRMAEEKFARWTDAEYNTAVARARTAKQFSEFSDPDRAEVFPNLRWLPSRSVTPRLLHQRFSGKVWAKNDPFWNNNAPGTEWNCKCDIEETDDPCTDNSALGNPKPPQGLDGRPDETGEIFTDKASYIAKQQGTQWKDKIKPNVRDVIRQQHQNFRQTIDTSIGKVLIDDITMIEVSKGSATDKSYFLKQEIALNIDRYVDKMNQLPSEPVDLSHNNPRSRFSIRKRKFSQFEVYKLETETGDYIVKFGRYRKTKVLNLYSIVG